MLRSSPGGLLHSSPASEATRISLTGVGYASRARLQRGVRCSVRPATRRTRAASSSAGVLARPSSAALTREPVQQDLRPPSQRPTARAFASPPTCTPASVRMSSCDPAPPPPRGPFAEPVAAPGLARVTLHAVSGSRKVACKIVVTSRTSRGRLPPRRRRCARRRRRRRGRARRRRRARSSGHRRRRAHRPRRGASHRNTPSPGRARGGACTQTSRAQLHASVSRASHRAAPARRRRCSGSSSIDKSTCTRHVRRRRRHDPRRQSRERGRLRASRRRRRRRRRRRPTARRRRARS